MYRDNPSAHTTDLLDFSSVGVNFTASLSTEHVWDAFVLLGLLEDSERVGDLLHVPHTGDQSQRFNEAMRKRNERFITYGQPDAVHHICDKCARFYELPDGEFRAYFSLTLTLSSGSVLI